MTRHLTSVFLQLLKEDANRVFDCGDLGVVGISGDVGCFGMSDTDGTLMTSVRVSLTLLTSHMSNSNDDTGTILAFDGVSG